MTEVLIHLTACEHLANDPRLYPDIGTALYRDLKAVKLGALFLDLPYYQSIYQDKWRKVMGFSPALVPWAQILHTQNPLALGLAFAELSQTDPEYAGKVWPLGFVMGYFGHLAVDRVINGLAHRLVRENLKPGEDIRKTIAQCKHLQNLFFHREYFGKHILGTALLKHSTQVYGIHRGHIREEVSDFMRKGCWKALAQAPTTTEIQKWAKGFHQHTTWLSLPFARAMNIQDGAEGQKLMHTYYRNDFFDFVAYYNYSLDMAVEYLNVIYAYMTTGDFSQDAQEEVKDVIPEMDILNPIDDEFYLSLHENGDARPREGQKENIVPFQPPKKPTEKP